jgi:hypothetical protein
VILVLPFISWTWVIGAEKDGGYYPVVLSSHFIEDHYWFLSAVFSQRAFGKKNMPSVMCQGYISTRKHS